MGKQYIQIFIEQHWAFLTNLRDNHWWLRDRLIKGWNGLDPKVRTAMRTSFWQFMQNLDRAFEAHRDAVGQYRDQQLMRYCLSEEDEAFELIRESVFYGPLHDIYTTYERHLDQSWDGFFSENISQPIGQDSGMIEAVYTYKSMVIGCSSEHPSVLNEALDSLRAAAVA